MPSHYDALVVGIGGVGSAALYELARRGARVAGLDRFGPAHDRGSSHGRTRIIRKAYFEHSDYVPLLHRAYQKWQELTERREPLMRQTGLLEVGPADGAVVPGVLGSSRQHNLRVESLSAAEVHQRWPGFRVPEGMQCVFEPDAGYLRVEPCVLAHLTEAQRSGAECFYGTTVRAWRATKDGAIVETDIGEFTARRLILTAGPWATELLGDLGVPLVVRRKPQFWFDAPAVYDVDRGVPAYLFELPEGIFYGFPRLDERGVKVAEHTGGAPVADPLSVDRAVNENDRRAVESFLTHHLLGVTRTLTDHSVCMYTMSPDEHFIVDRHPEHPQVVFAAGLSGHGFKFTGVLGEALADLALEGATRLPVDFLSLRRFR